MDVEEYAFEDSQTAFATERVSNITGLPSSVSSPKVGQLFNIFHPSDPISYRIEPLVAKAMTSLKPQVLPYTKKSLFANVAPQGLSGLGSKVGQSVSGLWSSLSAGITTNMMKNSLGLSKDDVARMSANGQISATQLLEAGKNDSSGGVIPDVIKVGEQADKRKNQLAREKAAGLNAGEERDVILIDDDLETLYSKFQKKREEPSQSDGQEAKSNDAKAQKMRREERKVRALNKNGRIDYSIQE